MSDQTQPPMPPQPPTPPQGGGVPQDPNAGGQPVPQPAQPQPPVGQGAPAQPAQPPQPTAAPDPNARVGQLSSRQGHLFVIPPHPNTQFDEAYFLALLEGSISLTMEEKKRVIDAIPRLSIEQINELISIFEEEKQKFAELEREFADDVAKLKAEREKEITVTEMKQEEAGEDEAAKAEAEALKKQLGL